MMLAATALAHSGTQTVVTPSPCPFWKLAVIPAVVATRTSSFGLAARRIALGRVAAVNAIVFTVDLDQLQSARAPPVVLL